MKTHGGVRAVLSVLLPLIVLGAGVGGFVALRSLNAPPPRRPTRNTAPVVRVLTLQPRRIELSISGYGTSRPSRQLSVIPEVGGKAVAVSPKLKVGAFLDAGEVLLQIDPTDYKLARDRTRADVQRIGAQIAMLEQEKLNSQRQVEVLRENVDLARQDTQRIENLARAGNASPKERDDARRVYLQQKNALVTYENQVALVPTRIAEAKAMRLSAEAQLQQAQADLDRTKIVAPFPSRVVESQVEQGQVVQKGQSIATLADTTATEVPVMVEPERMRDLPLPPKPPKELRHQGLSIPAEVRWVVFGGRFSWEGRLVRIEPIAPTTRTVAMVVEVANPWQGVRPGQRPPFLTGMYCRVEIQGVTLEQALVIPRSALREGGVVYVVRDGRLEFRRVAIRARLRDVLVIQNSLSAGDQVVVSPVSYPVPGMAVTVQDAGRGADSQPSGRQGTP